MEDETKTKKKQNKAKTQQKKERIRKKAVINRAIAMIHKHPFSLHDDRYLQ